LKDQWTLILALIFALIVAIFAVVNVNPVEVHYVFGMAEWPLILVIIGSAVMGAIAVGAAGIFRLLLLQKRLRQTQKENEQLKKKVFEHEENEQLRKKNHEREHEKNLDVIEEEHTKTEENEKLTNRE
jgi:lipopolysaccharide assembly protein A